MKATTYEDRIAQLDIYPDKDGGAYSPAWYYALGLAGEAGETVDKLKKLYRDKGGETFVSAVNTDHRAVAEFRDSLALELGDVLWYLTRLANKFGFSLHDIMRMNITKLEDRQRRNVQRGEGDAR